MTVSRNSLTVSFCQHRLQAAALKAEANAAFAAKDFAKASDLYSQVSCSLTRSDRHVAICAESFIYWIQAIAVDGSNHVLYSNRSASKASLKDFAGALEDAEKVRRPHDRCASIQDHQLIRVLSSSVSSSMADSLRVTPERELPSTD